MRRTKRASRCTGTKPPSSSGGAWAHGSRRLPLQSIRRDARFACRAGSSERARREAASGMVTLRRTWRSLGVWWCRGFACPPSLLPTPVEIGLRSFQALEAQPFERCSLRMTDARLHLPLSGWVVWPAWQSDHGVVLKDVSAQRIECQVVPVRLQDPSRRLSSTMVLGTPLNRRNARS